MSIRLWRVGLSALAIALIPLSHTAAHEIVGNRFFPATLGIDDPGVNDELSLPTVDSFKTGDVPPVRQRDISAEFSKRITEDFAISFGTTYTFLGPIDPTAAGANGFQNLETTFKYRVFKNPEHEFVMSVGSAWSGAAPAPPRWVQNPSTPTRRRSISAKGWAICRTRCRGSGQSRSPARSAMRSRAEFHDDLWRRSGQRCPVCRYRVPSARAELGRDDSVQHALSEIRGDRSWPAGFRQSPDPAGRGQSADAGVEHLYLGDVDHGHHPARRDLGRQHLPDSASRR